jgi:apolipoprotein D and lipocalin family protein
MNLTTIVAAVAVVALAAAGAARLDTRADARAQASAEAEPSPLQPLPQLDVPSYMGTWYQVAYYPNRFQRRCVSDTRATYRQRDDGRIEVANRCREADGRINAATGLARPAGSTLDGPTLTPAALEVSFLPRWLHWVPAWGTYWVIDLAPDGRWAVVSEPQRRYLWVLSRAPQLRLDDEAAIRSTLSERGFDLARLQPHAHTEPAPRVP